MMSPSPRAPQPALRLDHLCVGHGARVVVCDLAGQVPAGLSLAVTGRNGSGKSTLIETLAGRLAPVAGHAGLTGQVAFLPQRVEINREVPVRVWDFAALGLWRELGPFAGLDAPRRARIVRALDSVGLLDQAEQMIATLSGGQFRRLCFARLVTEGADILLLDEPFAGMDEETVAVLSGTLETWVAAGKLVVASLHNEDLARRFDRRLHLADGHGHWSDGRSAAGHLRIVPAQPA